MRAVMNKPPFKGGLALKENTENSTPGPSDSLKPFSCLIRAQRIGRQPAQKCNILEAPHHKSLFRVHETARAAHCRDTKAATPW